MVSTVYGYGFLVVSAVILGSCLIQQRILVRGFVLSAASGLLSLFIVSLLAQSIPLGLTFNFASAGVAVLYGLPGVIGMLLLRLMI